MPKNHWKTGDPSGKFNMTKYDENITKVLTYIYGDDLSLNQSDFENPDWRLKVIGPNDKNSNWTFIHSMYSKLFMKSHMISFYTFNRTVLLFLTFSIHTTGTSLRNIMNSKVYKKWDATSKRLWSHFFYNIRWNLYYHRVILISISFSNWQRSNRDYWNFSDKPEFWKIQRPYVFLYPTQTKCDTGW